MRRSVFDTKEGREDGVHMREKKVLIEGIHDMVYNLNKEEYLIILKEIEKYPENKFLQGLAIKLHQLGYK